MSEYVLSEGSREKAPEKIERKLRVGIIGTGWIAHSHVDKYLMMEDAEVVCGADLIPGKAKAFFEEYKLDGVRCYTDFKKMIDNEELDVVSVCTYNRTHAECAIYALEHGVNVLLEKPFTVTLDEAVEVCKAEKKSGKLLSIGFQPRFDPNMKKVKEIVESGVLGKIYYIQTGGGRRRGIPASAAKTTFIENDTAGIGALGDIGCYALDLVLNAIGYPKPLTVTGYVSNYFGTNPNTVCTNSKTATPQEREYVASKFEVDDFGAGFIRLEGGIILDFRIAWAMNINTPGDTIILGTEGGLRIPSTDCWNGGLPSPMKIYHQTARSQVETEIPLLPNVDHIFCKIRSFLDAIKEGGTAPVPSSQIIINQAIIDGIVKSSELGEEIKINIPEI